MKLSTNWAVAFALLLTWNLQLTIARAQSTAFTYQGRLNDGTNLATGIYDFRFAVYDAMSTGFQQGSLLTNSATVVSNGLFIVTLDFGNQFPGAARWLEIAVRTNGAGTFFTLSPRQRLTPAPYAITAGSVSSGGLASGSYSNAVTFNNTSNQFLGSFSGNGTGLTNVNADTLGGLGAAGFWKTSGNGNTIPGMSFLGTTDNQPLELWVNQSRALRLEPGTNTDSVVGAPNVIGGAPNNHVDAGIYGATIGGGGAVNMTGYLPGPSSNHVAAIFGTIGGGRLNTVGADHGSIGGGITNTIQPFAYDAVIGGGNGNTIQTFAYDSVIGGGNGNTIEQNLYYAIISGGVSNTIQSNTFASVIGGGFSNTNNAYYSVIGGGLQNTIQGVGAATVAGGYGNTSSGGDATVGGGAANMSSGNYATVAGGYANFSSAGYATIGGGSGNASSGGDSTVGGGAGNSSAAGYSTVSGGYANTNLGTFGTVAGGEYNLVGGFGSTVSGGTYNTASLGSCTVAGGYRNTASADYSTVAGGQLNGASGTGATVAGGYNNQVYGNYSFAAGLNCTMIHSNSFMWSDGSTSFNTQAPDSFNALASGGYWLYSGSGVGVHLPGGGGSWASISDRNVKTNFDTVNPLQVLAEVTTLPMATWSYRTQDPSIRHIGPMAQDFYAAFKVGEDNRHITEVDEGGVALAAIQGLNQKLEEQKAENTELKQENGSLEKRLENLEQMVQALAAKK